MPEAILLKDVETLGEQGSVVDVSKGYLRNYLIPRKLAQPATTGALAAATQRAAAADRAARQAVEQAQETAALLSRTVLTSSVTAVAEEAGLLKGERGAIGIETALMALQFFLHLGDVFG